MKIGIAADIHLNTSRYGHVKDKELTHLPFRTVDAMKSFEFVTSNVLEEKPKFFVIAGDTYDNHSPNNDVSGFMSAQLKKLIDAKITTIIMVGNHDVCQKHHALKPLRELDLEYVKIVDSPTMIVEGDYVLMFFPYSLEIEQDKISTKEQFYSFTSDVRQEIVDDPELQGKKILFFGHFGVQGAILNQYGDKPAGLVTDQSIKRLVKKSFRNSSGEAITINDLDTIGADYVFLGDYHKHQVLPTTTCKAMYVGSTEKSDINEMGQKKGFIIFDDTMKGTEKLGQCKYIEYKDCRPFIDLRGNWSEIKGAAKQLTADSKGAIVRISFVGNKNQLVEYNANADRLKDWLKQKIDPVHIMCDQDVIDEAERTEATETEEKILQTGDVGDKDVLAAAITMIEDSEKDKEEMEQLKIMAEDIFNEAISRKK